MGTIWIEGQFKRSAVPVKIVGGKLEGSNISQEALKNYVTKSELDDTTSGITAKLDDLDHSVTNETLTID